MTAQPPIRFTSRTYETLFQELVGIVKRTRPDLAGDLTQSELGLSLMRLLAYVGDQASYTQDANTGDVFPATARLRSSLLRFARSIGYFPATAQSALVQVRAVSVPALVTQNGAVVRAGSRLSGANGLSYEVVADTAIPVGSVAGGTVLVLREGESFRETFAPALLPNQEVAVSRSGIDFQSWNVYVGQVGQANLWRQVPAVGFESADAPVYEASIDDSGRLRVLFGDGVTGGRIPQETITVTYRTTAGLEGNAPSNSIRGTLLAEVVGTAQTVTLEFVNSGDAATGGENPESVERLRRAIPAFIQASDSAIRLDQIEGLAVQTPGVSLAYADVLASTNTSNVCKLYIWGSEQVDFRAEVADGTVLPPQPYIRYAQAGIAKASEVAHRVRSRTVWNTLVTVQRPTIAYADVYFAPIRTVAGVDRDTLSRDITAAVLTVFESGAGISVRHSDIIAAVEGVEGVLDCLIDRIVFEHEIRSRASGFFRPLALTENIADGTVVSLDDGARGLSFEFTGRVDGNGQPLVATPNAVAVPLGLTLNAALSRFIAEVNARMDIRASRDPGEYVPVVRFEHRKAGTQYNRPVLLTNVLGGPVNSTVDGLDGGTDTIGQGRPADGAVVFQNNARPSDGDYLILSDGVNTRRFEFDSNNSVQVGSIPVPIGPDVLTAQGGLITAINTSDLNLAAFDVPGNPERTTRIVNGRGGIEGNVPIAYNPASVLFCVGMGSGTGYAESYRDDMRRDMRPAVDQWPVGAYVPGTPGNWLDGGILPYRPVSDLVKVVRRASREVYDASLTYNNTVHYDSVVDLSTEAQAIVLRRLVLSYS